MVILPGSAVNACGAAGTSVFAVCARRTGGRAGRRTDAPRLAILTRSARAPVVIALSSLRGSSKVNVLVGLLRKFADDETRQIEVVRALGRVGDALVLPALRRARSGARSSRLRAQLQEAEANVEKRIQEKASTR